MAVRNLSANGFGGVCTMTLTFEIRGIWVEVMTKPLVMDNKCVKYHGPDTMWTDEQEDGRTDMQRDDSYIPLNFVVWGTLKVTSPLVTYRRKYTNNHSSSWLVQSNGQVKFIQTSMDILCSDRSGCCLGFCFAERGGGGVEHNFFNKSRKNYMLNWICYHLWKSVFLCCSDDIW